MRINNENKAKEIKKTETGNNLKTNKDHEGGM